MKNSPFILSQRWPRAISGVGILLGVVLVGELFAISTHRLPPHEAFYTGVVTSAPFIVAFVYGGYWLERSHLRPDQYSRLGRWWVGGMIVTALVILSINGRMQAMSVGIFVATARWSGAIGGAIGFMIGVSQARAVRQAIEAEEARIHQRKIKQERDQLEQVASIVSHDLRNPLSVASGQLELLREEHSSPHIENISSAHDRMATIIEDTLTLAEAGQTVGDTAPVELASLATTCWETVESAGATISIHDTGHVLADRDRLKQLFENLFRNAIEHAGPDVCVTVGTTPEGFYVADNGPGIPSAKRARIFEAGYTTEENGTGFGLSIVQQIATGHNWEVRVTDADDGGARFEIAGVECVQ